MLSRKIAASLVLPSILALTLAACAPATPAPEVMMEEPAQAVMEKPTETVMEEPAEAAMQTPEAMMDEPAESMTEEPTQEAIQTPEAMSGSASASQGGAESGAEAPMNGMPAYFSAELTDARSGESFTIADFKGKVVLVETLAQWCSNCLKQQNQVYDLHALMGKRDDFVSLGLDIDPNEDAVMLKEYVKRNGFHWLYAVSPAEVSREIANLYGNQFLNPPSTPMFIIDRYGQVHPLPFGIKSADELMEALQPFLEEGL